MVMKKLQKKKLTASSPSQGILRWVLVLAACVLCAIGGMEYGKRSTAVINEPTATSMVKVASASETTGTRDDLLAAELEEPGMVQPEPQLEAEEPTQEHRIFSLSLPSTNSPVLSRYFDCAGHDPKKFGRYWTNLDFPSNTRKPIGKCMKQNLKQHKPIMRGCGDYDVWQDLSYFEAPMARRKNHIGYCFDPVMFPGALEKMYRANPNATIINMIKEPSMWYKTLPFDLHVRWATWCNPSHDNAFPMQKQEAAYLQFYENYHQRLRDFVKHHPSWTLVEIDFTLPNQVIADTLQMKLGIKSQCWLDSTQGNIPLYNTTMPPGVQTLTEKLPRPNDITYPLLVATLEKSGTSTAHSYFACALGPRVSVHQWTNRQSENANGTSLKVGKCWEENVLANRPALDDCGHHRVFADINLFNPGKQECYFPALEGGLEAFAKSYPYGTVLMQLRNATSWYSSIKRWYHMDHRWATSPKCRTKGVTPHPKASAAVWEDYYETYTKRVRQAMELFPTLTYIEVPLSDDLGPTMDNVFGFSRESNCWGHKNANPPKENGSEKKGPVLRQRQRQRQRRRQ